MKTTAVLGLVLGGVLVTAMPALADSREEREAVRATVFVEADGNGDGALTPAEFEVFHARMKEARSQAMFARRDENGDGQLTADELDGPPPGKRGCRHYGRAGLGDRGCREYGCTIGVDGRTRVSGRARGFRRVLVLVGEGAFGGVG